MYKTEANGLWSNSASLSKAKRNYFVTCRELLVIVKTLEHFQMYLYGQEFHSTLTSLLSFRNLQEHTARCVQRLQGYDFTSAHRHGIKHKSEAVSR
jgi:hypothetical protein